MALKSPFLAAESSAARRSRAFHRFTAAAPVLLLVAVGTVGHVRRAPYAHPSDLASYDREVLAYAPRVAAVQAMSDGYRLPPFAPLRREAKLWIEGIRLGRLVPLEPAYFEDHLRDSPRGEVLRSGLTVSTFLSLYADRELQNGRAESAMGVALEAAQVAHGLRGFEMQGLLQSLLVQRRATTIMAQAWPSLPVRERTAFRPAIKALFIDARDVARLQSMERDQFEEYRRRHKVAPDDVLVDDEVSEGQQTRTSERSIRVGNALVRNMLETSH